MDSERITKDWALEIEALKTACMLYAEARLTGLISNDRMIKNMCEELMKCQWKDIEYYTEELGGYVT